MKLAAIAAVAAAACLSLGTGCLWANERSDSMYGFEGRALIVESVLFFIVAVST